MKLPLVIERHLGGKQAKGLHEPGLIQIDPRLDPPEYLDTLIHESLHETFPYVTEDEVTRAATIIAKILWRAGYRRVDL